MSQQDSAHQTAEQQFGLSTFLSEPATNLVSTMPNKTPLKGEGSEHNSYVRFEPFRCGACDAFFDDHPPMQIPNAGVLVAANGTKWRMGQLSFSRSLQTPRPTTVLLHNECVADLLQQAARKLADGGVDKVVTIESEGGQSQ